MSSETCSSTLRVSPWWGCAAGNRFQEPRSTSPVGRGSCRSNPRCAYALVSVGVGLLRSGGLVVSGNFGEVVVQGSKTSGFISDVVPETVAQLSAGALGTPTQVEAELDVIKNAIRRFWELEPDIVMRMCSALSARLSELHVDLFRAEGRASRYRTIRTQQVRTLLEEVDRQHKIASRLLEVRRQDIELSR